MDAEKAAIGWLGGAMGVPVRGAVPRPRPPRLVIVERTGGAVSSGIDRAQLAVQCWAPSPAEAAALAVEAEDALTLMGDEPWAALCEVGSRYRFPPPEGGGARYQLTVEAHVYA